MRHFERYYDGKSIKGDVLEGHAHSVNFLMLHGAGAANKDRFAALRKALYTNFGMSSIAFDFINHGASSKNAAYDSLAYRTDQAKAVIDGFFGDEPLHIVASSMSAYIAIKLTELYAVATLVLVVPAVYNRNAYEAAFKDEFTTRIRRKDSWVNTDAWELLEGYRGRLLVISAENDAVIPKAVVRYIFNTAINARSRKHVEIPTADHQMLRFITEQQQYCQVVSNEIHSLVKGG